MRVSPRILDNICQLWGARYDGSCIHYAPTWLINRSTPKYPFSRTDTFFFSSLSFGKQSTPPHFKKPPAVTHVLFFKLHAKWRHVGESLPDQFPQKNNCILLWSYAKLPWNNVNSCLWYLQTRIQRWKGYRLANLWKILSRPRQPKQNWELCNKTSRKPFKLGLN